MNATSNIFVIGDLVLDHAIFARLRSGHSDVEGEKSYHVQRRQDSAGGAANTARILALLSKDKTFLWGIVGQSHWGDFRTILQMSQALDGSEHPIELRGIRDETDPPMNTITRLIDVTDSTRPMRVGRFDDLDHAHVPDDKRMFVMHHLRRVHTRKDPLSAVIINDFDKHCVTKELAEQVAHFCDEKNIPLFVDPRHERGKYDRIKGTAVLMTLDEWWHLVGRPDDDDYWRRNFHNRPVLLRLVELSLKTFPKFRYHIITCPGKGALIIAPHPNRRRHYAVYRAAPDKIDRVRTNYQLGCGGVQTGVLALEYVSGTRDTPGVLLAFQKANAAVACYSEMPWHRMPSKREVLARYSRIEPWSNPPVAELTEAMLHLPEGPNVRLADYRTAVPGLVSTDAPFKEELERLLHNLRNGNGGHAMLAAEPGNGKSTILKALTSDWGRQQHINVVELSDEQLTEMAADHNRFFASLREHSPAGPLVLAVDEATKEAPRRPSCPNLTEGASVRVLDDAMQHDMRFLLIDANFYGVKNAREAVVRSRDGTLTFHAEPLRRLKARFELPGLEHRLHDLAVIAASAFMVQASAHHLDHVYIEAKVLESIVARALGGEVVQTVSDVVHHVEGIVSRIDVAHTTHQRHEALRVTVDCLDRGTLGLINGAVGDAGEYLITP